MQDAGEDAGCQCSASASLSGSYFFVTFFGAQKFDSGEGKTRTKWRR